MRRLAKPLLTAWFGILLVLGAARPAAAQYQMTDSSTTYDDSWGSTSGVYGWGQTIGGVNIHTYAVDVYITSPHGRHATTIGYLAPGVVTSQAYLDWYESDFGDYTFSVTHRGLCSEVGNFIILSSVFQGTVGYRQTYFSNPWNDGAFPGSCTYRTFACTSGTPTCTGGAGLGPFESPTCPMYIKSTFLVYTRLWQTSCFPLGWNMEAVGPGPCT